MAIQRSAVIHERWDLFQLRRERIFTKGERLCRAEYQCLQGLRFSASFAFSRPRGARSPSGTVGCAPALDFLKSRRPAAAFFKPAPRGAGRARSPRPRAAALRMARLMLRSQSNPQHSEKNNHNLLGCFLDRIERRFLCQSSLRPNKHITPRPSNRRRQRRDSSNPAFQRAYGEPSAKRHGAHHGLPGAGRSVGNPAGPIAGFPAGRLG